MTEINPRLDYSDSREDIAELYPGRKNDSSDYGPRARLVIESAGIEAVDALEILDDDQTVSGVSDSSTDSDEFVPEQLQLLPEVPGHVPLKFRLSEETRRSGLKNIQKIRDQYFNKDNE
jgi:hypothetical protein